MNSQSTYISEQIRDASGEYINPSTIEGQEKILEAIDNISLSEAPLIQGDNVELITLITAAFIYVGNNYGRIVQFQQLLAPITRQE